MMSVLNTDILVNYYFEEISKIPRGSYNERKIADYLEDFAKQHELKYNRDKLHNVVIYKVGTAGYEEHEPVMLQAHMDMVNEKNKDSDHDFDHDPLDLYIEDGFVAARGTTLGADDGYGVAYMLAMLSDPEAKHPPLECVFTVAEEVGLDGALGLDGSLISAKRMIGLDSEKEGELCTTSSGGCDVMITKELQFVDNSKPVYELLVKGLLGGHSGGEIHQGRGNANKLAARVLYGMLKEKVDLQLIDIDGGLKNNAIPRECLVTFASDCKMDKLETIVKKYQSDFKTELEFTDPNVTVSIVNVERKAINALRSKQTSDIIKMMVALKNGFVERSHAIEGLTTVSLNMGVVNIVGNQLKINYLLRSPMASAVSNMIDELDIVASAFDSELKADNYYPGWNYEPNSKLREQFKAFYLEYTGKEIKETATHGGLETGIFKGKKPDLDIITMGPDTFDIHTPDEKMDIASFVRCYDLLKAFIATL